MSCLRILLGTAEQTRLNIDVDVDVEGMTVGEVDDEIERFEEVGETRRGY